MKHFDVVVIGGGHAGAEAAAASARMGARTALVTMSAATIGVMSCNPAIGGLGKGHLVREIDALDGLMGRAADLAGIQFRLLNRRKGPAVQGPRAQADRKAYREAIQRMLSATPLLDVVEGEVSDLLIAPDGAVTGCVLLDGSEIRAHAVVITTGTFLNGVIHVGDQRRAGGRAGDPASLRLAARLGELGLKRGRLKTGTPPRLDGKTINWSALEQQPGDDEPTMFSFLNHKPLLRQIACGITHTNERTHDIVRANLAKSAMYGGHIEGVGPRYCPSIEDKVVRFSDKASHQVYLEPEGLDDDTIYPNGISSSLPEDVQEAYVRSIVGLESVRILQPAYAIEYDFFDPRGLGPDLSVAQAPGLYFAGQINGTTGYEEAAAQGLVAGANAAAAATGLAPVRFSRSESYIGVLLDDLICRGVTEPYRMFTSRAEHRLYLRADNADQRLTRKGVEAGLVKAERREVFSVKMAALEAGLALLQGTSLSPKDLMGVGLRASADGQKRSAYQVLSLAETSSDHLAILVPGWSVFERSIQLQLKCDALYSQYIDRQTAETQNLGQGMYRAIPEDFDYHALSGLSSELTAKLSRLRPRFLTEAAEIEGMTPSALVLLLANLKKLERRSVSGR